MFKRKVFEVEMFLQRFTRLWIILILFQGQC